MTQYIERQETTERYFVVFLFLPGKYCGITRSGKTIEILFLIEIDIHNLVHISYQSFGGTKKGRSF